MDRNVSRRSFVRRSVSSAATLPVLGSPTGAALGANERLRVGFIGVGTRGFGGHVRRVARLKEFGVNVDLAAFCDVYKPHEERAVQFI